MWDITKESLFYHKTQNFTDATKHFTLKKKYVTHRHKCNMYIF